jgi:cell division transport system permease protein
MFLASCAIITASLIILGVFLLLIFNIEENIRALDEKPQVQIYCRYDLTDDEVGGLEELILSADGIKEFYRVTKDEALSRAKELLGENSDILDGIEPDFLPVSFILKLDEPEEIGGFVSWLEEIPEIDKISYPKRTIDLIAKISDWTKVFGLVLAGIPILFAIFIVSNTIRIAVFERRSEISIMRYIGATERIIKWPFIVEGVFTGIVGGTIAFLATGFGYKYVESNVNLEMASLTDDLFRLVGVNNVSSSLILTYLFIGVGVGAVGSARSIRKYLRV